MKPVIRCSLLVTLVQLAGVVACNPSESSSGKAGGSGEVVASSPPVSSEQKSNSGGKVAESRTPVDCTKYLSESERISVRVGSPRQAESGSWGGVATALRVLPPGATLCGALYMVSKNGSVSKEVGSVAISSALNADEVRTFYDPVLTNAGCTFAQKTAGTHIFSWNCPKQLGSAFTIIVERDFGVFAAGFIAASP